MPLSGTTQLSCNASYTCRHVPGGEAKRGISAASLQRGIRTFSYVYSCNDASISFFSSVELSQKVPNYLAALQKDPIGFQRLSDFVAMYREAKQNEAADRADLDRELAEQDEMS